jgi:hypothetical protein
VSPRERITTAVRTAAAKGAPALIAYLTAGFPQRAQFRAQLRGDLAAAQALLPLRLLPQPRVTRLLQRDLGSVRLGGVARSAEIEVDDSIGAPRCKHDSQRPEHDVGEPLLTLESVTDPLQHVRSR